jgi:plasmid stabilization system protein ParE
MRRLTILPQAELDVSDASAWYEGRRRGLGDEFLDELDSILRRVVESPLEFPKIKNNIRRALLRRFPYSAYFAVTKETVELVALLHQRRDAQSWEKRIIAE